VNVITKMSQPNRFLLGCSSRCDPIHGVDTALFLELLDISLGIPKLLKILTINDAAVGQIEQPSLLIPLIPAWNVVAPN
jgi:hypothetical protein